MRKAINRRLDRTQKRRAKKAWTLENHSLKSLTESNVSALQDMIKASNLGAWQAEHQSSYEGSILLHLPVPNRRPPPSAA